MKTAAAVLLTILASASQLTAQPSFERWFGGGGTDYCFGARQTLDAGYLVYGYTTSYGAGGSDVWLVKTDVHGDTVWTRTIGGNATDVGTEVLLKPDSGFVVGGYTSTSGAGMDDFMLLETDADGDTLWLRTYGDSAADRAYALARTADGGYVLAGETESYGAGDRDVWVVRTNALGDTAWTRAWGSSERDGASGVVQTPDGGFAIIGYIWAGDEREDDAWLVRTDSLGDTLWTRTYGGERGDYGFHIEMTDDHGFVFAGRTYSFGGAMGDAWLVRTDSLGDTLWMRNYGGSDFEDAHWVCQTSDSGFVLAGGTKSFGAGDYDAWLIKTGANGDSTWARTFGGSQTEYGVTVEQTPDGGFVVGGYTTTYGAGSYDFYIIKTDPDGNVAVAEPGPGYTRRPCAGSVVRRAGLLAETERPGVKLFDAMGRQVRDPVRAAPGVYVRVYETGTGIETARLVLTE